MIHLFALLVLDNLFEMHLKIEFNDNYSVACEVTH